MPSIDREDRPISDIIEEIMDVLERADLGADERSPFFGSVRGADPFRADYGFSIDWRLDPDDSEGSNEHLVDSRREDDEMSVVADLPDVDGDDVELWLDESDRLLEIRGADGVIERVSLPWPAEIRTTRLNNGVLDVRLGRLRYGADE